MNEEPIMSSENNSASEATPDDQPSHLGLIIGFLIILLTFILIGLYMWVQTMTPTLDDFAPAPDRPTAEENNEPESTKAEAQAEVLDVVSTSDELSAIEADLDATALDDIDGELNAIETELDAAIQ